MFRERLISGIVLVLIAFALIFYGGDILLLGLCIISMIAVSELFSIIHIEKSLLGLAGYAGVLAYFLNLHFLIIRDSMLLVLAYLMLLIIVYVIAYPKYTTEQLLIAFFAFFYVAVMLSCIYLTRSLHRGIYIVWLILLCSWGSDTCAYCVGVLFGRHKLAPKLSPKKSIEGAVGGVAGSMLLTGIYGRIFDTDMGLSGRYIIVLACLCGLGAIISMFGDLAASAIKRNYKIKDFGKIIPGHGGILDRFDSVIITAPIIYYIALNFI